LVIVDHTEKRVLNVFTELDKKESEDPCSFIMKMVSRYSASGIKKNAGLYLRCLRLRKRLALRDPSAAPEKTIKKHPNASASEVTLIPRT